MSIIIHGITKEEFAKRMMGEGITIIDPDILGSFDSFFGHRVEELPPHGRLIDADRLEEEPCDLIDDRGLEAESGYSHDQIRNAPTIIEAEEKEQ